MRTLYLLIFLLGSTAFATQETSTIADLNHALYNIDDQRPIPKYDNKYALVSYDTMYHFLKNNWKEESHFRKIGID